MLLQQVKSTAGPKNGDLKDFTTFRGVSVALYTAGSVRSQEQLWARNTSQLCVQ